MKCPNCDGEVTREDEHRTRLTPAGHTGTAFYHGWTCTAHNWRAEALALRDRPQVTVHVDPTLEAEVFTVFAPAFACYGSGRTIEEACTDLAADIREIRDACNVPDEKLADDMLKLKRLFAGWDAALVKGKP